MLKRCATALSWRFDHYVVERLVVETLLPRVIGWRHRKRHRQPPSPANVRSVLVWNIDSLGDSLWITPTLRGLRQGYRNARISLACNAQVRDVFATNPHVDELVALKAQPYYSGRGLFRPVPELAGRTFDVAVVLEMGSRPADRGRLLGRQLGAGYIVSNGMGLLRGLADHTLPAPPVNKPLYWADHFQSALEHLGLARGTPNLELFATLEDKTAVEGSATAPTLIGLHPCVAPYARSTKMWPLASFAQLATILARHRGRSVQFVITGSADERRDCEELKRQIDHIVGPNTAINLAGRFTIRQTYALLTRLDVLVTADTAALHLGAAAKTPTVALFGATDPTHIAPPAATVMRQKLACSPCHQARDRMPFWPRCIYSKPACMEAITPESVAAAVESHLAQRQEARTADA